MVSGVNLVFIKRAVQLSAADWLIWWVVVMVEVEILQRRVNRDPFQRIPAEHLLQQPERLGVGAGQQSVQRQRLSWLQLYNNQRGFKKLAGGGGGAGLQEVTIFCQTVAIFRHTRLWVINISILPLNSPKVADFQPQILYFGRKLYNKKKIFWQAKI